MCCGDSSLPWTLNCRISPASPLQLPTCTRTCLSNVSSQVYPPPLCSKCVLVLAVPSTLHCLLLSWLSEFLFGSEFCFPAFYGCWKWVPLFATHLQTLILHAACARLDSAGASGATGDHPVKANLLVVFSHEALLVFIRWIYSWNLHWRISWMLLDETLRVPLTHFWRVWQNLLLPFCWVVRFLKGSGAEWASQEAV